jgi:hypothetical protein
MLSLEASQKDNPVRSAIKKRRSVPLDRAINSVSGLYPHSAIRLRISANAGKTMRISHDSRFVQLLIPLLRVDQICNCHFLCPPSRRRQVVTNINERKISVGLSHTFPRFVFDCLCNFPCLGCKYLCYVSYLFQKKINNTLLCVPLHLASETRM